MSCVPQPLTPEKQFLQLTSCMSQLQSTLDTFRWWLGSGCSQITSALGLQYVMYSIQYLFETASVLMRLFQIANRIKHQSDHFSLLAEICFSAFWCGLRFTDPEILSDHLRPDQASLKLFSRSLCSPSVAYLARRYYY